MAGKAQTSIANQTMKFVYSEAVNRALRQRCRGLAAASATTTDDDGPPPLPPELLLAVLQSGDLDLSAVVAGKSSRLPTDVDATADDVNYEIANLAEIYREISSAVEQVRRRSTNSDASTATGSIQQDRPVTRATVKTPAANDEKNKPSTVRSPRQASYRTTVKDSEKRQKDGRKVQFRTSGKDESAG